MAKHKNNNEGTETTLQELLRHSQSLLRLSKGLEIATSYAEVIAIAAEEIKSTIGYPTVWVYLFSDDRQFAYPLAADGSVSDTIMSDEMAARQVIPGDPMLEEIATATDIVVVDDAAHQGTGLGLSITQQFVQLMGGQLSVNSTPGQGALFRIDLPLEAVDESDLIRLGDERPGRVIGLAPDQSIYRILIAEDQRENQRLLSRLMSDLGLEVKVAENGEECVELFREWQPHLIWMDRHMPRMDGVEATRRIRQLPDGDKVKIISVTASVLSEQREELIRAGMDDFVNKPYRFEELYDCLERHLGLHYRYADKVITSSHRTLLTPEELVQVESTLRHWESYLLVWLKSSTIPPSWRH
jgi:CheY-like chemotaxis protein